MSNYSKQTLTRIGRLMNADETSTVAPLLKIAKSGGFGRKALYNWSLPESDPQYRKMPRSAKRMVAMLAYFSAAGLLNDKRMEEIVSLEATLENEAETNTLLRKLGRVMGSKATRVGGRGKPEGTVADEEDDELDVEDEDEAVKM